jgi:hypothetical protein
MQIRSDHTVARNNTESTPKARTVRVRDSVLAQLRQLGMDVEDDDLLSELDTFEEDELIAVLGLFGLLGYFALLGLLGKCGTEE